jgi:hypothetical protein
MWHIEILIGDAPTGETSQSLIFNPRRWCSMILNLNGIKYIYVGFHFLRKIQNKLDFSISQIFFKIVR